MAADDGKIQQYLLIAKGMRGRGLADLIARAVAEPGLFAFGELLDVPSVAEIAKGDLAPYANLLQLFAYGTWAQSKEQSASLPELNSQQALKLKQLTVAHLANKSKSIPYQDLMQQLDVPTVRELEDFIITECFYTNLIKGKLDQKQGCLQVHDVVGRDVRREELSSLDQGLGTWLGSSEELLRRIEGRIQWAMSESEAQKKHQADVEAKQEEMKKNLKTELELRNTDLMGGAEEGAGMDFMDEDRIERPALMDRSERADRLASRPKSRRR